MRKLWKKNYSLRAGDFDKYDHIKPSAVLELFQDAAGQHAEELGVGFAAMLERSYLWVLTRIKFRVLAAPRRYQDVVVKTWPLAPNRLNYRREYCIEDTQGAPLIVGSSEWVVIHSEKRRFLSVPDLYPFADGFYTEQMIDEKLRRVADFEEAGTPYIVTPGFGDLDLNDHVNNTKYAGFVLDAIDPSEQLILREFQIDYRKEVMQGTPLQIYCRSEETVRLVKGQNADGDIMFACCLQFEER